MWGLPNLYPSFDDRIETSSPVPSFVPANPSEATHGVRTTNNLILPFVEGPVVEDPFGFEEAGKLAGLWFGMVWSLSTFPIVAIDGPLPIADIGWAWQSFRITQNAIETGGQIGAAIDGIIE